MSDCLWGLLDGINDAGLAVSLAFGGRRATGPGFAIAADRPLPARDLRHDRRRPSRVLRARCPVQASYNLTIARCRAAHAATARSLPTAAPRLAPAAVATNHQRHRRVARARRRRPQRRARGPPARPARRPGDREERLSAFLAPPLHNSAYDARLRHALHGRAPPGRRHRGVPLAGRALAAVGSARSPRASAPVSVQVALLRRLEQWPGDGGTSSAGLRSKKPTGLSQNETVSTDITGHSSGARDVVDAEHVPEHDVGVLDRAVLRGPDRQARGPRSLWTTNSPHGQRSSASNGVTHSVWPIACARWSTGESGSHHRREARRPARACSRPACRARWSRCR